MDKKTELKNRILKGISHFEDINPSEWDASHAAHAKVLHKLMESYLNGEDVHFTDLSEEKRVAEQAREVFGS